MAGQIGAIFCHVLIVLCSTFLAQGPARGWATLGLLMPFLVCSQGCISTVTWLMAAEIFPLSMRGVGTGICMLAAWSSACAVGQLFPVCLEVMLSTLQNKLFLQMSVHNFGQAWTFGGFALLGLISLLLVWLFLPETRNKTLEELEQQFQSGDWAALKKPGATREQRKMKEWRHQQQQKSALGPLKEVEKY